MDVQLLAVPYDSGIRGARMGAGPERLLEAGIERELVARKHGVASRILELPASFFHTEMASAFALMRMLSGEVRQARTENRLPIVLAGNCNTSIGALAGVGCDSTGVAWFDAHADFNTPETTTSGFLDGTALATMTGRCWTQLALTVPGFSRIPDGRVCLVGARDPDSLERRLLEDSEVKVVAATEIRTRLKDTIASIARHADRIYVHIDLDVLDTAVASANCYAVGGGLTIEDVERALALIGGELSIAGITLSAYDPAGDSDGRAAAAAIRVVCAAADAAGQP